MVVSAFGFVLGAVLGSFIKVLADRSLSNKSFRGRSYCTACKHKLAWYDLLPIVSYFLLHGKCRYCHKTISFEYVLVEVASGAIIALLFWQTSTFFLDLPLKIFFVSVLLVLFITDLKKMFIPDRIILPAIVITLIYLILETICKIGYLFYYLSQSRIGQLLLPPHSDYFQRHAIITTYPLFWGMGMALLIGGFFTLLILITKGRGMGGGDVKLGALIGLSLGFPGSLVALMLSFISGAFASLVLIAFGKKHFGQSIPFGPFLVFGSIVSLLWGNQLIDWYLHIDKIFFL